MHKVHEWLSNLDSHAIYNDADAATVELGAPEGFYLLSNNMVGPNVERWRSFTVPIFATSRDKYELVDLARRRKERA
jgi:hypothetical protein